MAIDNKPGEDGSGGAAGAGAFSATYSDFKLVRGRKVIQVVLELPIEKANEVLAVLGGMPNPASETWVGVARLVNQPSQEKPRRRWEDMTPAQQAGVLCGDESFRKFLQIEFGGDIKTAEDAANRVRAECHITSRADLNSTDSHAYELWKEIVSSYRDYQRRTPF